MGRIRVDATTFTEAAPVATPHIGYRGLLFPLERYPAPTTLPNPTLSISYLLSHWSSKLSVSLLSGR